MSSPDLAQLQQRAKELQLHGVLSHWSECSQQPWLAPMLQWEHDARGQRSMERRLRSAQIGRFLALADFDWSWPEQCDQAAIQDLMSLGFLKTASNAILVGTSGLGKTTIAQNIAYQAVLHGHTVIFTTAGKLLGDLASLDSDSALRYRLRRYANPALLVIDEVGYLSYSSRHADLLFELISRRHEHKSTLITTNKSFADWSEVFPNASCVLALIDRLIHHAEIIGIEGKSYRQKEALERAKLRASKRTKPARTS